MSSKKNGSKKLFEGMPVEPEHGQHQPEAENPEQEKSVGEEAIVSSVDTDVPTETDSSLTESAARQEEPSDPDQNQTADDEGVMEVQASAAQDASDEDSADDLLEDVRRSLIEEETTHEQAEQSKWWKRIGRGSRKKTPEPEPPQAEEINLPNVDAAERLEEPKQEVQPEEDLDSIDDLIDLLGKQDLALTKPAVVEEAPPEPEKVVDIEELKKQAFQSRPSGASDEDLTEVRSIALEGGEEVFVEVQSTKQDPLEERLSAMENALKPYRRLINFGLALLGLVMAVIAALVLFNIYKQSAAVAPAPEVVSNLPFPTSVSLPGGWSFPLGKGSLVGGQWNPAGAEWLQGTEVCRWVALPWSRQLEAVVRTLNPDDPIDLGMSNNDVLTYRVSAIEQMSPAQMQELNSNKPCLLIVLANPEEETRWVLTAVP
jgi:hypothetical protein